MRDGPQRCVALLKCARPALIGPWRRGTATRPHRREDLASNRSATGAARPTAGSRDALPQSLAANGSTQPQWWVLDRLDDTSRTWARSGLVEELAPYGDKEEGRGVADEIERLVDGGLVAATGDAVAMTGEGGARLAAARERNGRVHGDTRAGLTDEEYATAIDVLRRIVGNLGGDPLP